MFANPILGGNNTLIREAIRSPNYVAGVSGWSIEKNGTAEFNNVTLRGNLYSRSPINGSGIEVISSAGEIRIYPANNNVGLDIRPAILDASNFGSPVTTAYAQLSSPYINGYESAYISLFGEEPGVTEAYASISRNLQINGDLRIPFGSLTSLGLISGQKYANGDSDASNSASVGATETVVMTLPSFEYIANTAYKVTVCGRFQVDTLTTDPIWRLRKTNATGQTLCLFGRTPAGHAGQETALNLTQHFGVGSSNVTASLVLCVAASASTNVFMAGGFGGRSVTIEPVDGNYGQFLIDSNTLV